MTRSSAGSFGDGLVGGEVDDDVFAFWAKEFRGRRQRCRARRGVSFPVTGPGHGERREDRPFQGGSVLGGADHRPGASGGEAVGDEERAGR